MSTYHAALHAIFVHLSNMEIVLLLGGLLLLVVVFGYTYMWNLGYKRGLEVGILRGWNQAFEANARPNLFKLGAPAWCYRGHPDEENISVDLGGKNAKRIIQETSVGGPEGH